VNDTSGTGGFSLHEYNRNRIRKRGLIFRKPSIVYSEIALLNLESTK
jgi:hypothetical protein